MTKTTQHKHQKLGEFFATSICGNDILSSALYVSGIAITFTGIWAPAILLLICLVLFFYKFVYREVVEALPLNGGAYNCLLNAASKKLAATAGTMTILSYMATAVISGVVGVQYLTRIINVPVIPLTIVLFIALAVLVISGIKDSARLAAIIFSFHVITLSAFTILGIFSLFHTGTSQLVANFHNTAHIVNATKGGLIPTLVLGFSASLLGVSGFESSANFVEEQRRGVFNKTLRNMLLGVTIFNPLIALIVLNSLSIAASTDANNFLLAVAAKVIGGPVFSYIVVIDAFVVLWGAVLTAFVGVSGLMHRMAGDGCLPNMLTKENKSGSFPYIVIAFLILCCSVLIVTKGNLLSLAGVYTIAFLGVMSFFALGNLLLKSNRPDLKRPFRASAIFAVVAFIATFSGMIGNIYLDWHNFLYFCYYFVPTMLLVFGMMYLDRLTSLLVRLVQFLPRLHSVMMRSFNDIISGEYVAFVHHTSRLASILNYIYRNETGRKIHLIVCRDPHNEEESEETYHQLLQVIPYLRLAGVYPNLDVRVYYREQDVFGPNIIGKVAKEFRVRRNRICVGSIHEHHPYSYEDLGGVRIIS
jgi:amino acid transporter